MRLTTMFDLIQSRSYFSRPDSEIWASINTASRFVFYAILKEDQLFWLKTDTSSVAIVPNTTEYALPADFQQMIRIRERLNSQDDWRCVEWEDIRSDEMMQDVPSIATNLGQYSPFSFTGPYFGATQSQVVDSPPTIEADEVYTIQLEPLPQDNRQVELKYIVKFLEVAAVTDPYVIPDELRDVVCDLAVAELVRGNNDSLADVYTAAGTAKMSMALTAIREKQLAHRRSVEPYLYNYL